MITGYILLQAMATTAAPASVADLLPGTFSNEEHGYFEKDAGRPAPPWLSFRITEKENHLLLQPIDAFGKQAGAEKTLQISTGETRSTVQVGVVTDTLWEKFCKLFSLDALWADESIRENNNRVAARDRIMPQIRELIAGYKRDDLIALLDGTGLPFAPIARPEDMFDDPHLNANGGLEEVVLADGTKTKLPALPIEMNGTRPSAPAILKGEGADTGSILLDLGFTTEQIATLRAQGTAQ